MHAISNHRGNRPTNKHNHKPTNRQDRLQYTAPQLARSVIRLSQQRASLFCAVVQKATRDGDELNEKALRETQTLGAGCSKAEPKIFAPPQTSFPGARDGQKLISWRWSLPLPTNPVWWGSMHEISSYRDNRPTNTQTQPQTHRQDRLQYTALHLARSVMINLKRC